MWELVSFIQGKIRRTCLNELSSGPKTPNMISKGSGQHLSHISRALRELAVKGLVECVTPKSSKNRFYKITSKGKGLLKRMSEIDRKNSHGQQS